MRTLLIDDEQDALDVLRLMLERYCAGLELVGTATTVDAGIALIQKEKPDLVFLDVEMPTGSGFEILSATKDLAYRTIFTTAH